MSPYHAMGCNPVSMVDPLGLQYFAPRESRPDLEIANAGKHVFEDGTVAIFGASSMMDLETRLLQADERFTGFMINAFLRKAFGIGNRGAGKKGGSSNGNTSRAVQAQVNEAQFNIGGTNYSASFSGGSLRLKEILEPVEVKDGKANWADWGKRMYSGYGKLQTSGMNIWQAAYAETRTREEIELSKSETLERAAKAGYLPFRPDAAGVTINYNLIGLSGGAGSITFGYVGNDLGIWATNGVAVGTPDVSFGITIFNAEYRGDGEPNMESFMGTGRAGGFTIGPFSAGYSQGLNSQDVPVWHSYSGGAGIGVSMFHVSGQYQPYNYTTPIYKH